MSKVRYKIRREQLERVVEHFVMESAMIEKNAAKKHKMSMGAEQADDMGDGMMKAPEVKKNRMKQAPEVKKNIKSKVSEARMRQIQELMETYDITEDELQEIWPFGGKKTPEELVAKGQKIVAENIRASRIYKGILADEAKYGENAANKYLMFIALNKGEMVMATWNKELDAPDGTKGFWSDRGVPRSGYDVQTTKLQ